MRIAIVGCGEIGVLSAQLLSPHHTLTGLRRSPQLLPQWLPGIAVDVTDPASLKCLREQSFDLVIYQVAASGFNDEAYHLAYVEGLSNVIDCLGGSNTRLLFVSSTGVYHQNDDEWVDENSETWPTRFNGQKMLEGEALVAGYKGGTVVRFSGIYGPRRTRLIEQARSNPKSPSPDGYTNRIHIEDCAGVIAHLVEYSTRRELQTRYLASDSLPALRSDVFLFLVSALEDSVLVSEGEGTAGVSSKKTSRIAGSKRCSNRRLLETGYTFRYPDYRQGYQAIIDSLQFGTVGSG